MKYCLVNAAATGVLTVVSLCLLKDSPQFYAVCAVLNGLYTVYWLNEARLA